MPRPFSLGKPRCPCCGHFALSDAEKRVLVALVTSRARAIDAEDIGRVSGVTHVRRIVLALKGLGFVEFAGKQSRFGWPPRSLYRATEAGMRAAGVLAGRGAAAE